MSIIGRILPKSKEADHPRSITIAFLGDSVTQGCFEIYINSEGRVLPVTEAPNAYAQLVLRQLSARYPDTPFHIINAGRSGDRAPGGLKRLQRDVLSFHPDLAVVCYGLNDCSEAEGSVQSYASALTGIFEELREAGSEIIFMTPNTMNFYVSPHLTEPAIIAIAERKAALQTSGRFDQHIDAAKALCRAMGICVCDCYALWQEMRERGVDVTELLSNKINHPTREMHTLFADELIKTLFKEEM